MLSRPEYKMYKLPKRTHSKPKDQTYDYLLKFVLIGDEGVGKQSLLLRFIDNSFTMFSTAIDHYFKTKTMDYNDRIVKLQIWSIRELQYKIYDPYTCLRGTHSILLVYDATDRKSFNNIMSYYNRVKRNARPDGHGMILVGTKMDSGYRQVSSEEGEKLAYELGIPFIETSARLNVNVTEAFQILMSETFKLLHSQFKTTQPLLEEEEKLAAELSEQLQFLKEHAFDSEQKLAETKRKISDTVDEFYKKFPTTNNQLFQKTMQDLAELSALSTNNIIAFVRDNIPAWDKIIEKNINDSIDGLQDPTQSMQTLAALRNFFLALIANIETNQNGFFDWHGKKKKAILTDLNKMLHSATPNKAIQATLEKEYKNWSEGIETCLRELLSSESNDNTKTQAMSNMEYLQRKFLYYRKQLEAENIVIPQNLSLLENDVEIAFRRYQAYKEKNSEQKVPHLIALFSSSSAAAAAIEQADENDEPEKFLCPITLDVMKNPVMVSSGHTYDKASIETLGKNPLCPITNKPLTCEPDGIPLMFPNLDLKLEIEDYLRQRKKIKK